MEGSAAPRGLLFKSRPEYIQQEIDRVFAELNQKDKSKWGLFNGDKKYKLAALSDRTLIDKVISRGLSHGKTQFVFVDVGAGNFQWGKTWARYIRTHPVFCNFDVEIYSLRGEQYLPKKSDTTDSSKCKHYRYGSVKIENILELYGKLNNKVDLVVSSWCLVHLVDPAGFVEQVAHLLNPEGGLFLFDGFEMSTEQDKPYEGSDWGERRDIEVGKIVKLLSALNFNFFMQTSDLHKRLNCFVAEKHSPQIPRLSDYLSYKTPEQVEAKLAIGGQGACVRRAFFEANVLFKVDSELKEPLKLCGKQPYATYGENSQNFFKRIMINNVDSAEKYKECAIRLFNEIASKHIFLIIQDKVFKKTNDEERKKAIVACLFRIIKYNPASAIDGILSMLGQNAEIVSEILNTTIDEASSCLQMAYYYYIKSTQPEKKADYIKLIEILVEHMMVAIVNMPFKFRRWDRDSASLLSHATARGSHEVLKILQNSRKVDAAIDPPASMLKR